METIGLSVLLIIIIGIFAVIVFIKYKYIAAIEKKQQTLKTSEYEMYKKMSFQEEQLHYNLQRSVISGTVAHFLYKYFNKK